MEMIKKLCIRSESLIATNIASMNDMRINRMMLPRSISLICFDKGLRQARWNEESASHLTSHRGEILFGIKAFFRVNLVAPLKIFRRRFSCSKTGNKLHQHVSSTV
jgi:sigma54-dependent transcription regulator